MAGEQSVIAALFDPAKHPHRPGGDEHGGEWAPKKAAGGMRSIEQGEVTGFPEGVLDEQGKVLFWPKEIGSRQEGPFWKAIAGTDGKPKAFWFADQMGNPHHVSVARMLGDKGAPDDIQLAGFGSKVSSAAPVATPWSDQWTDEQKRAFVGRYRRDIADASDMVATTAAADPPVSAAGFSEHVHAATRNAETALHPQLADAYAAALAAVAPEAAARFEREAHALVAGFDPAKHPHRPAGDDRGGEWAPKEVVAGPRSVGPGEVSGFPEGVLDEDGRVLFWPKAIGSRGGDAFWKGLIDRDGNEKAFWFANDNGFPHHAAARVLLNELDPKLVEVGGYGMRDAYAQPYGTGTGSDGRRRHDLAIQVGLAHSRDISVAKDVVFAREALAAAGPNREFTVAETPDDLVPKELLAAEIEKRTRHIREMVVAATVAGVLTQAGISFAVGGIFSRRILDQVGARVRDAELSTRDAIRTVIDRAQAEGWTVPETAGAIKQHIVDLAPSTATQLARTDLIGTANASSIAAARMVFAGQSTITKSWLCVAGDTLVVGRPTRAARRVHSGRMVTLRTSRRTGDSAEPDRDLTVTPNHAILTTRGWVPAQFIEPGDCVLGSTTLDRKGVVEPHVENAPATIEEVFGAASEGVPTERMVSGVVDLDGEGEQGYVDVVTVDGELRDRLVAHLSDPVDHLAFATTDVGIEAALCFRPSFYDGVRQALPDPRGVPLVIGGEGGVAVEDPPCRTSFGMTALGYPSHAEDASDGVRGAAEVDSDGAARLAREVSLFDVVAVEIVPWSGHVYDLETEGGWFLANGMIVHNSTEDERTRPTHAEADGQTVPLDGQFRVGTSLMDYPGDPSGPDGEVVNCRCSLTFHEGESLTSSVWEAIGAVFRHP